MRILTLENEKYELDVLPEEIEDMRFSILDNSNNQSPDYMWIPLIFLESYSSPALVLNIGGNKIKMPVGWQILIGEPGIGELEVLPLTSINDRGFKAFQFNPLTDFRPTFVEIEIVAFDEAQFFDMTLVTNGQILCVPIEDKKNPQCVYFVKDISRSSEIVFYDKVF